MPPPQSVCHLDDDAKTETSSLLAHGHSVYCSPPKKTNKQKSLKFEIAHCQIGVVVVQEQLCPLIVNHTHPIDPDHQIGCVAGKRKKSGMCQHDMMSLQKVTKTIVSDRLVVAEGVAAEAAGGPVVEHECLPEAVDAVEAVAAVELVEAAEAAVDAVEAVEVVEAVEAVSAVVAAEEAERLERAEPNFQE